MLIQTVGILTAQTQCINSMQRQNNNFDPFFKALIFFYHQGDSGGALTVIDDDGIVSQVGVTSFVSGTGCHTDFPAGEGTDFYILIETSSII